MTPSTPAAGKSGEHIVYFDWLKFLVVYGIVVYHTSLPFSYASWLIESRDRSLVLTAFTAFTFPWGIPVLFLLSGAGEYFGLSSRPLGSFVLRAGARTISGFGASGSGRQRGLRVYLRVGWVS